MILIRARCGGEASISRCLEISLMRGFCVFAKSQTDSASTDLWRGYHKISAIKNKGKIFTFYRCTSFILLRFWFCLMVQKATKFSVQLKTAVYINISRSSLLSPNMYQTCSIIDTEWELKRQVHFGARCSFISLKQQQSRLHENPLILWQAAFGGAALMDAFRAYGFISSKPGVISLLHHTVITPFLLCSGDQVLSHQTRPSIWLLYMWNQSTVEKGSGATMKNPPR